jgi:hypothetical protein
LIKLVKSCVYCGKTYETNSHKSKYCSQTCNTKSWRERNPEKALESQRKNDAKRKGINRYNSDVKKEWYKRKKKDTEWADKIRQQGKERHDKVQRFIRRYKLMKGCVDCGFKGHHVALDFDHLKDKKLNVSLAKSITQAKEEIRKCEVVCSNCHRVRTFRRLYNELPLQT